MRKPPLPSRASIRRSASVKEKAKSSLVDRATASLTGGKFGKGEHREKFARFLSEATGGSQRTAMDGEVTVQAASQMSRRSIKNPVGGAASTIVLRAGYMLKCDFKRAAQRAARNGRVKFNARSYNSRWFELFSDRTLKYKQRKDSTVFKGVVSLSAITSVESSRIADAPELALDLVTPDVVYTVSPTTVEQRLAWQDALRALLPRAKHEASGVAAAASFASLVTGGSPLASPKGGRPSPLASPRPPMPPTPAVAAAAAAAAAADIQERMSDAARAKRSTKRQHIAAEFINYERHYVEQLDSFLAVSVGDLELRDTAVKREFLSNPDIALVLSNLKQILRLDQTLLRDLERAVVAPAAAEGSGAADGGSPAKKVKVKHTDIDAATCALVIGNAVDAVGPLLTLYASYAACHDKAVDQIRTEFMTRVEFTASLKFKETDAAVFMTDALRFENVLIRPIQHIVRHRMYLDSLTKALDHPRACLSATDEVPPDVLVIERAMRKVLESASHVNETIRLREQREELGLLAGRFKGDVKNSLLHANRFLVRWGRVSKVSRRKRSNYVLHLFNDVLLYSTEAANSKFLLRQVFALATCAVSEDVSELVGNLTDFETSCAFGIRAATKSFIVIAESTEEREEWVDDLKKHIELERAAAIQRNPESGAQGEGSFAAAFVPDDARSSCSICLIAFSIATRRHHCRKCGELVCDACSPHRRLLPHIAANRVRVCDICEDQTRSLGQTNVRLLIEVIGACALPLGVSRQAWCVLRLRQPLSPELENETLPATGVPTGSEQAGSFSLGSAVERAQRTQSLVLGQRQGNNRGKRNPWGAEGGGEDEKDQISFSGANQLAIDLSVDVEGGDAGAEGEGSASPPTLPPRRSLSPKARGSLSLASLVKVRGIAKRLKKTMRFKKVKSTPDVLADEAEGKFDVDWRTKFELGAPRLPEASLILEVWCASRFGADIQIGSGTIELDELSCHTTCPFDHKAGAAEWGATVQVPLDLNAAVTGNKAPSDVEGMERTPSWMKHEANDGVPSVLVRLSLGPPIDLSDAAAMPKMLRAIVGEFTVGRHMSTSLPPIAFEAMALMLRAGRRACAPLSAQDGDSSSAALRDVGEDAVDVGSDDGEEEEEEEGSTASTTAATTGGPPASSPASPPTTDDGGFDGVRSGKMKSSRRPGAMRTGSRLALSAKAMKNFSLGAVISEEIDTIEAEWRRLWVESQSVANKTQTRKDPASEFKNAVQLCEKEGELSTAIAAVRAGASPRLVALLNVVR